jgi:hypothetical protein
MNEFFRFQYEIDDALTQSARDLRRLVEFYRRHGKIECANQVEQSLPKEQSSQDGISKSQMSKKQEKNKSSHFHWLHLPEKRVG